MKKNTLTVLQFIMFSIFWNVLAYSWYRCLLFKSVFDLGKLGSHLVLGGIILVFSLANYVISGKYGKNEKSIYAIIAISYGIYAFLSFFKYMKKAGILIAIISLLLACSYLVLLFGCEISPEKNRKKVMASRKRRAYLGARNIVAYACTVFLVCTFVKIVVLGNVSKVAKPTQLYGDEYSMINNIDMFLYLQPEEWEKIKGDIDLKLNILQTVVNCEGRYLSFDKPITLHAADLEGGELAYYNDKESTIFIDMRHLDNSSSEEVLRSLTHECMHVAQHQLKDIYDALDSSDQNSYFMMEAARYEKEINNYKGGNDDYLLYYSQRLESMARAYGITATNIIFSRIAEYLEENGAAADFDLEKESGQVSRSIDDLYAQKEPLVARENIFNDENDLVQYMTYEYDENNRYSTVSTYQKNSDTKEMELFTTEKYTYDDYFCYKETVYASNDNLTTKDVYDLHGNVILAQLADMEKNDVTTNTYSYRYTVDTKDTEEEYCYSGEGMVLSHYFVKHFNEHGDEIYSLRQDDFDCFARNTAYSYDAEGRIVSKAITDNDIDFLGEQISTCNYTYTYNQKGQLVKETNESCNDKDALAKPCTNETISYEYDDSGRLLEKRRVTVSENEAAGKEEKKFVYTYEYGNT